MPFQCALAETEPVETILTAPALDSSRKTVDYVSEDITGNRETVEFIIIHSHVVFINLYKKANSTLKLLSIALFPGQILMGCLCPRRNSQWSFFPNEPSCS